MNIIPSPQHNRFLAVFIIVCFFILSSPTHGEPAPKIFKIDIPTGFAHETMTQLAKTTNTQLIFPFDQVKHIQTKAIKGHFTFQNALERMLKNTSLKLSKAGNGVVTVFIPKDGEKDPEKTPSTGLASGKTQDFREMGNSKGDYFIEEISVTARKRLESIRDVPFSIAARTSAAIFLSGYQDFSELARGVAGLTFTDLGPGQSQVAIRGISAGQVVRDQPGVKEQVGIYLDESVISMALFTPDLDFFDLDRVEVLRGPQGTLYGSGSLSGTIRYISKMPDLTDFSLSTEATIKATRSDNMAASLKMALNLPLIDNKLAIRTVGYYNDLLGYVDARFADGTSQKDINDGKKYGGRIALTLKPHENFQITPRLVFQRIDSNGFPRVDIYNVLANPFTERRPKTALGPNEQFIQLGEGLEDQFLMTDLLIHYDFDRTRLTAITSYIDRNITVIRDSGQLTTSILAQPTAFNLSGPVLDLPAPLIDQTNLNKFSQEIRLTSTDEAALQFVVGAFYTTSDRQYGQDLAVRGFKDLTGLDTTSFLRRDDILYYSHYIYNFKQWALFGEATYHLSDRLKLTGGLRWFEFTENRHMLLDGLFPVSTPIQGLSAETISTGLTPRLILEYKAKENIQLNAQIAKGFRLGGINDPLNRPLCTPEDFDTFSNRQTFKDEELWNYEIGLKSSFNEGKLTFDASVFYANIQELQATVDAGSCSSRIILNVPRARSIGVETELHVKPHPDFDISFSASLQEATIRSSIRSLDLSAQEILSGIKQGNHLPTSPRFQASTQINYYWHSNEKWDGFLSLSLHYVGSSYTQIKDQVPGFGTIDLTVVDYGDPDREYFVFDPKLPSYKTGNIRIGLQRENLEISLFVNNIWNEVIRSSLDRERGGLARIGHLISPPRTFGLSLRGHF